MNKCVQTNVKYLGLTNQEKVPMHPRYQTKMSCLDMSKSLQGIHAPLGLIASRSGAAWCHLVLEPTGSGAWIPGLFKDDIGILR